LNKKIRVDIDLILFESRNSLKKLTIEIFLSFSYEGQSPYEEEMLYLRKTSKTHKKNEREMLKNLKIKGKLIVSF